MFPDGALAMDILYFSSRKCRLSLPKIHLAGVKRDVTLLHSDPPRFSASVSTSSVPLISKAFGSDSIFGRDNRQRCCQRNLVIRQFLSPLAPAVIAVPKARPIATLRNEERT
jgi:hypothetical protein